jgi:hypothetical protein
VDVVTWVLLGTLAVYVGAVFYGMRKGLGAIITALESIDQRLAHLEAGLTSREGIAPPRAEE